MLISARNSVLDVARHVTAERTNGFVNILSNFRKYEIDYKSL